MNIHLPDAGAGSDSQECIFIYLMLGQALTEAGAQMNIHRRRRHLIGPGRPSALPAMIHHDSMLPPLHPATHSGYPVSACNTIPSDSPFHSVIIMLQLPGWNEQL